MGSLDFGGVIVEDDNGTATAVEDCPTTRSIAGCVRFLTLLGVVTAVSKNSCTERGTSSYSGKRRRSSSAISTVTSRDQPSAVLKATIRTGWLKLVFQETADQSLAVGAFLVCLAPGASEPAKIV